MKLFIYKRNIHFGNASFLGKKLLKPKQKYVNMIAINESNYYTENQGMMLSAMNAVTIWAIEQSITGGVKRGEESEQRANYNMNTNQGTNAEKQTKPYVLLAQVEYSDNNPYDPEVIPIEPAQPLDPEQIRKEETAWAVVKRIGEEVVDFAIEKIAKPSSNTILIIRDSIEKGMEKFFPRNAEACPTCKK